MIIRTNVTVEILKDPPKKRKHEDLQRSFNFLIDNNVNQLCGYWLAIGKRTQSLKRSKLSSSDHHHCLVIVIIINRSDEKKEKKNTP